MVKKYLFLIIGIFLLSSIYALDKETFISCGGDEQLLIGCIGDNENTFFNHLEESKGKFPENINEQFSIVQEITQINYMFIFIFIFLLLIALILVVKYKKIKTLIKEAK